MSSRSTDCEADAVTTTPSKFKLKLAYIDKNSFIIVWACLASDTKYLAFVTGYLASDAAPPDAGLKLG